METELQQVINVVMIVLQGINAIKINKQNPLGQK
jgi:hypothetical protein